MVPFAILPEFASRVGSVSDFDSIEMQGVGRYKDDVVRV